MSDDQPKCAACGSDDNLRGVNLKRGSFAICADCREEWESAHGVLGAVRQERDEARAEVKRLRRLALVRMKPGKVPTEPGWYVVAYRSGFVRCEEHDRTWAGHWDEVGAVRFARIPVEALGEVADG